MGKHGILLLFIVQQAILLYALDKNFRKSGFDELNKFGGRNGAGSDWGSLSRGSKSNKAASADYSDLEYEIDCGLKGESEGSDKIYGGENAAKGEFPWHVYVLVEQKSSIIVCNGAIIGSKWVVTAAECVVKDEITKSYIIAGLYNAYEVNGTQQQVNVEKVFAHEGYDADTFLNNIALLKLSAPIKLDGANTRPICIPKSDVEFKPETLAIVTGWGEHNSSAFPTILQKLESPLVAKETCNELFGNVNIDPLEKCQICAGRAEADQGTCHFDVGGPLVCPMDDKRYYLCGLVTHFVNCGDDPVPSLYTELVCYSDWIRDTITSTGSASKDWPSDTKNTW